MAVSSPFPVLCGKETLDGMTSVAKDRGTHQLVVTAAPSVEDFGEIFSADAAVA